MDITGDILEQALKHFDSAGVVAIQAGVVLILGLGSTPETNLDEAVIEGGRFILQGWLKHMKPRVTTLRDVLRERGFEAEAVGWWGYPRGEEMQLKPLAVAAGLGMQGKNTLVLHPKFGPWLRLAAIRTSAPLIPTGPGIYERRENPLCQSCQACIKACPVKGLLQPYRLLDPARCRLNISPDIDWEKVEWCDMGCVTRCPVGR